MSDNQKINSFDLIAFGIESLNVNEMTIARIAPEFHVPDISTVMPGVQGKGIKVAGLLDLVTIPNDADHVTFISQDGKYSASLTMDQTREYGILVYEVDGQPLPSDKGGPFRLVTPGLGDLCANVKNIGQIKVSSGPGNDTRPEERSC